jgi:hypothetical protein
VDCCGRGEDGRINSRRGSVQALLVDSCSSLKNPPSLRPANIGRRIKIPVVCRAFLSFFFSTGCGDRSRKISKSRRRCDSSVKRKSASEDTLGNPAIAASSVITHASEQRLHAHGGYDVLLIPECWAQYASPKSPARATSAR